MVAVASAQGARSRWPSASRFYAEMDFRRTFSNGSLGVRCRLTGDKAVEALEMGWR